MWEAMKMRRQSGRIRVGTGLPRTVRVARLMTAMALVVPVVTAIAASSAQADDVTPQSCGKRYVAGGDHYPAGHEVSDTVRWPRQLLDEHLTPSPGPWCLRNTSENDATTATYYNDGQLANTWNYSPDFITLEIGQENATIKDIVTTCFEKYRDPPHDFEGAKDCEDDILGDATLWTTLRNQLITILQQYKMIMAGRPKLIVAVVGYPNPYPQASDAQPKISPFCDDIEDSTTKCNTRWNNLPGALTSADMVIKKINLTIENVVKFYTWGYQGRFVFVNPYQKFLGHCMRMQVTAADDFPICHLCGTEDQYFDGPHTGSDNFGCSDPWFVAQADGTATPTYLTPADQIHDPPVVLSTVSQTTSGMGVHPNDAGHDCISDLVWEAVKQKLGVPEAPATACG